MKAVLAVLVGIAIAAGGFGLYLWLDEDDERGRAEAAANEFVAWFTRAATASSGSRTRCEASTLEPLADGKWRFHLDCGQGSRCMAIDLEHFKEIPRGMYAEGSVEGVSNTACGPESWTAREAAKRLRESKWAKGRKAEVISCDGRGAQYAREFNCHYISPGDDGFVVIHTTDADTFEVEPSR